MTLELERTIREKENATRHVNKMEKFIAEGKERLETNKKALYDTFKITARNIFYKRLRQLRPIYNNRREDHQILRELSTAHGYVSYHGNHVLIELAPTRNYQSHQKTAIEKFLRLVETETNQRHPDRLPVKFALTKYFKHKLPR